MSNEVTKRRGDKKESVPTESTNAGEGTPSKRKVPKEKQEDGDDAPPHLRYGPMPRFSKQRLWSRGVLILGLLVIVWYNSGKTNEQPFAGFDEDINAKAMKTKCSASHEAAVKPFPKCVPKNCGRFVVDTLFSPEEIFAFKDLMQRVFQEAKVEGAATVFDFHLGRLQLEGDTIDLYKLNSTRQIFHPEDMILYQNLRGKLQRLVSSYFGVDHWTLHPTYPVFMTRLTRKFAKRDTDEYWHPSVHQQQFKSYQYSTVLFLSDYWKDFEGGRLIFIDGDNTNRTVEPKIGRALAFTSGEESLHYTERVRKGTRFAITAGFTCNAIEGAKDPKL